MKKKLIMLCSILLLFIVVVVAIIIKGTSDAKKADEQMIKASAKPYEVPDNTVVVPGLGNTKEKYEMFSFELIDYSCDPIEGISFFDTCLSLDEIADTNKKDFVGDFTYYDIYNKYDTKLFLHNDTYYIVYSKDNSSNGYIAKPCAAKFINYSFLCPVDMCIDEMVMQAAKDNNINVLDTLYNNYTFEDACEFYSKLSSDVVTINKDNKSIMVNGYTYQGEKNTITLDFNKKTVSWKDSETGKLCLYTGNE